MKRIFFILLMLLFCFPISAQNDALLLFTRYENDLMQVYLFNATTGEEQFLTTLENVQGNQWGDVGWSPDGRYVWAVDTVTEAEERRLRLFEMASGEEELITEDGFFDGCSPSISWSPDGQILAYISNGENQHRDLNFLSFENGETRDFPSLGGYPIWSPDSQYLVVQGQVMRIRDFSLVLETEANAVFSPNSRYIVYSDENRILFVYDFVTAENHSLELRGGFPLWSPNSLHLIVQNDTSETSYSYYDVQTQTLRPIDIEFRHRLARFSPNSALLYFVTTLLETGGQQLWAYELATGEINLIFEASGWLSDIVIHEDWLAVRYSPDPPEYFSPTSFVRIMNEEVSLDIEVTIGYNFFGNAPHIAWSADGDWLMIHGDGKIYGFDPQTNSIEQLPVETDSYTEIPFWSPDGQYLAFETQNQLHIWDRESDNITILPEAINRITGWQGSTIQDSLLYCGSG